MSGRKEAAYSIIKYVEDNQRTFEEYEFNVIDGLVLSQIANIRLGGIVPSILEDGSITVEGAMYLFFGSSEWEALEEQKMRLLNALSLSRRFKDMRLSNYVENPAANKVKGFRAISKEAAATEQFAAITASFEAGENTINFMAFRATDGTMEGWNEDFAMIHETVTQAQYDSVRYMKITAGKLEGALAGGGHSKGGNCFAYGYMNCTKKVRERFVSGFIYDSPGMNEYSTGSENFDKLQELIAGRFICPQMSIIGMLLQENTNALFVNSVESGFNAHDPFSWEVLYSQNALLPDKSEENEGEISFLQDWGFEYSEQTDFSKCLNIYLDTALAKMSAECRRAVFDFVNYILFNSGVDEFGKLSEYFMGKKEDSGAVKMIKTSERLLFLLENFASMSSEERKYLMEAIGILLYTAIDMSITIAIENIKEWINVKFKKMNESISKCSHKLCSSIGLEDMCIVDFFAEVKECLGAICDIAGGWLQNSYTMEIMSTGDVFC